MRVKLAHLIYTILGKEGTTFYEKNTIFYDKKVQLFYDKKSDTTTKIIYDDTIYGVTFKIMILYDLKFINVTHHIKIFN